MKFRALLLSFILGAGASLAVPALAQNAQQQTQTPATSQPAAQPQPTQPPAAQSQTPADQSQTQPADQTQTPATDQSSQDSENSKEPKSKHDGGKKDVDAIGNRKVGGLDWYSIETDISAWSIGGPEPGIAVP